ncbi:hypothetical protein SAMN05421767_10449 [Granulicatella balaenopterae]|uniref:Peptidase_C39 like family protein n=1 Tax=Granulicatella balaenopterae TaxID=137733 RepID=A0A1H9I3T7_9LACT|nr:hypothetical protein [Granulicatella balaenopterae]SEQ69223.1 hypothetical protein SAMN05421767_10449 [Granulicatella balaenopterae]
MKIIKRHPLPSEELEWIGINEDYFKCYQSYINREAPGYCGSYSAAALTHYILKNIEHLEEVSMEKLLQTYRLMMEDVLLYPGTYLWDIARGLKEVLVKGFGYQIKSHIFCEKVVVEQLSKKDPLPVIVGTVAVLGSPYQNHWVVAYAYAKDSSGKLWFKIYDNHGHYKAIIPAIQTLRCCYVEKSSMDKG